jgi:DNA polymerase-1
MNRLLIVDGSNLLFQMFYGMPAKITGRHGKSIHGTIGFLGALLKIIRMVEPSHVAVLFDGECANERTELDPAYKADRPDYSQMSEEDTPFSQLPDIFQSLEHLGIRYRETSDCEADDWIAGYAKQYSDRMEIVIVSQDSDFFQLISERVRILRYRGSKTVLWDEACLSEKLGILPGQYAAYKALTGDTADNIRGIAKVGPKTAAALMRQFGDLDTLLLGIDEIRKPSVRESVRSSIPRIRLNHRLICLTGADTLPFSLEELIFTMPDKTSTQVLRELGIL